MSEYRWYHWLQGWIAGLAWDVFCWSSGYPRSGFVCDYPDHPLCERERGHADE